MLKIKCYISDWIIHSAWLCACRSHRCRHRSGLRSQTYRCRRRRWAERRRTCTVWNKRRSVWRRVSVLGKPSWTASSNCWRHRRTRWTRSHTLTRITHTFITLFLLGALQVIQDLHMVIYWRAKNHRYAFFVKLLWLLNIFYGPFSYFW